MDGEDLTHSEQGEDTTRAPGNALQQARPRGGHPDGGRRRRASAAMIAFRVKDRADGTGVGETFEFGCPRCGERVDGCEYCPACGLHLVDRGDVGDSRLTRSRVVLLSVVALIAVAGLGTGIYAIASQPQTSGLRHQVAALTGKLSSANTQLAALRSSVARAPSMGNVTQLQKSVASLRKGAAGLRSNVVGLGRHVGTLESGVAQLRSGVGHVQAQTSKLLNCLPQLEQQIARLNVKTTSLGGLLTGAALSTPTAITSACAQSVFGL